MSIVQVSERAVLIRVMKEMLWMVRKVVIKVDVVGGVVDEDVLVVDEDVLVEVGALVGVGELVCMELVEGGLAGVEVQEVEVFVGLGVQGEVLELGKHD